MNISPIQSAPTPQPAPSPSMDPRLEAAAKAMESLFTKQLLEAGGVGMPGISSKTPGSDVYADMLRQAIADNAAERGSFGIGRQLLAALNRPGSPS